MPITTLRQRLRTTACADDEHTAVPSDLTALDGWFAQREGGVGNVRPTAARRVRWQGGIRDQRDVAVAFIHGFSASALELSPVPERLADSLGAHLHYARLTGHGRDGAAMAEGSVSQWLNDVREALAVASRLGRRVVLIGNSTGGTLAAWLAVQDALANRSSVAAVLLLSPNLGLVDRRSASLLLPGASRIARAIVGEFKTFEPANDLHALHWTTSYPSSALVPMARLVGLVRRTDLAAARAPALALYDPRDGLVSATQTQKIMARYGGRPCQVETAEANDDTFNHMLAGDALGHSGTDAIIDRCAKFLARVL